MEAQENLRTWSSFVPLTQGPVQLWETDDEAEQYAIDPKAYIFKRTAIFTKNLTLATNNILIATYCLPEFTDLKGPEGKPVRFWVPDGTQEEARWQGRVGLLLAKGPLAWRNDERTDFGGTNYEVGDWVCFDRQDGRQTVINRVHCRRLKDVDIWGSTTEPYNLY
jgi:hypothetical protein